MQTRALRNLVKISQVKSFLGASKILNMTLSALSMQMKSLETKLGVVLFDRTVRPPRLTPVGRAIVENASIILENEKKLLELCSSDEEVVGNFSIGLVTSAAVRLLPTFLKNTRKSMRKARFEIKTGLSETLRGKVLSGDLDAAVITDSDAYFPDLQSFLLREEPFVFVAHPTIAAGGLDNLISKHTFFHFTPQTGIGTLIANAMETVDQPTHASTIMLDNLEAIMECVKNSLGFTLLPEPDVVRYEDESLVKFTPRDNTRRSLVLIVRRDGSLKNHLDSLASQFGVVG